MVLARSAGRSRWVTRSHRGNWGHFAVFAIFQAGERFGHARQCYPTLPTPKISFTLGRLRTSKVKIPSAVPSGTFRQITHATMKHIQ